LIREGATGVAGHVAEPYLQSTIRPDVLFPAYLSGLNLAEAFYAAMPHLSWQTIVIGDPLCAPFRRAPLSKNEIDDGVDSETLLPVLFSKRRVASLLVTNPGATVPAVTLAIRGDVLAVRGDRAAAKAAYEQATAQSPQIASAQLQLALMLDQAGQPEAAIERYRRVVAFEPGNALALNNLAYRLATDGKKPSEALPFALRAAKLVPQDTNVLDTLAWIQHLVGDHAAAVKTMAAVLKAAPNHPEIRLHAAAIYAASGAKAVAEDQLQMALKLRPSLEGTAEVKQLRQQIDKISTAK
jgi:tetratricopeptide (TPR) repeat protein